jgi:integrase
MPLLTNATPKYRQHKASGQAIITLDGRDFYLGPWRSQASRREYDRLTAEWLANHRHLPVTDAGGLTIMELAAEYLRHAKSYYRKDGKTTSTVTRVKAALRMLKELYGHTLAAQFGPLALQAIQHRMVSRGKSRRYTNYITEEIKRVFRWATSRERLPVAVFQALATVAGLRGGRTDAHEPDPIKPVSDSVVDATLPKLQPVVADMVRFQRATGCRPGEVCIVRPCDVDTSSDVWSYRPESHKTEHHGKQRVIWIGPRGQDVLRVYLLREKTAYCFSPRDSEAERKATMRETRKTKIQPSQQNRRKRKPRRTPGIRYTTHSFGYAVRRAADAAGVEPWMPNRLRHTAETEIRRQFEAEATRTVLGHSTLNIVEIYAERDMNQAAAIMRQVG